MELVRDKTERFSKEAVNLFTGEEFETNDTGFSSDFGQAKVHLATENCGKCNEELDLNLKLKNKRKSILEMMGLHRKAKTHLFSHNANMKIVVPAIALTDFTGKHWCMSLKDREFASIYSQCEKTLRLKQIFSKKSKLSFASILHNDYLRANSICNNLQSAKLLQKPGPCHKILRFPESKPTQNYLRTIINKPKPQLTHLTSRLQGQNFPLKLRK